MTRKLERRHVMLSAAFVAGLGALAGGALSAQAQGAGELRVMVGGGDWGQANIDAYVTPFMEETGINVTAITDQTPHAQLELMVTSGNVTVDVVNLVQGTALTIAAKGMLEDIDYSIYSPENLEGLTDFSKQPFGVAALIYSYVMVYNTNALPDPALRPATWADYWDVENFPGTRLLQAGQYGSEGPWEEALLADGVAPEDIYPMDIDRIFASLDRIKPHVRRWWLTGSEIQQLMHDEVAAIMNSYDGRAGLLIDQGAPLEINRTGSKLTWDYWAIPKGSPNSENAQKFIEFATRAENQAKFAQLIPYGPSNLNAYDMIPEEIGRKLASYPEYLESGIPMQMSWYAETDADGVANVEKLIQRWNDWILE